MPEYTTGAQQVVPEGDYNFVVDEAGEKISQKGNSMIELQLLVEHDGSTVRVFDYLVFVQKAFPKIDEFRRATGEKLKEGEKVNFEAEDCLDRKGRVHLCVDDFEGRVRNKVDCYLPPDQPAGTAPTRSTRKRGASKDPDDIPF
jgi:hypothetical protein